MDLFGILKMTGGLALFLYGMSIMGSGLEKMSGGRLERILEGLTSNPLKAVLLGAGVTAAIQSSSATTVMVVGFVNSGIMKFSRVIGIIMGANIGTTLTSWLLSLTGLETGGDFFLTLLKPSSFSPVLALIGILFYMSGKSDRRKVIGEVLLGFAVLMTGMETMSSAVKPLADVPEFVRILTMFQNPILGVFAGMILTAVIQSSSASVGILQALSVTGAFTCGSAIPIILGQNIGTCVTTIISAIGANKDAKRTAAVHLYFNVIGAALFLAVYYVGNRFFAFEFLGETVNAAGIALIHSIFNIFTTAVLLPFIRGLEKLVYLTIPVTSDEKEGEAGDMILLDDRLLNSPSFAIEQCGSLVKRMGEMARDSFLEAMEVLWNPSKEGMEAVIRKEKQLDVYHDKISAYLTKLNRGNLSYADSLKVTSLLHCLTDFERISDHATNIVECAEQMRKEQVQFSEKAEEEVQVYSNAVADILNRATKAFVEEDQNLAYSVEPLEEVIDGLNRDIKKHHVKRLHNGECTIELGLVLSDLAMNYERVADHCSNIAVYMMQLHDSQLEEHRFTEQLDETESAEFARRIAVFREKYQL